MSDTAPYQAPLLPIGKVAEQLGLSERTLRYYEEVGLITPGSHSPGGCRRYTPDDVARVAQIRELVEVMGYSLEEIQSILEVGDRLAVIGTTIHAGADPDEHRRLLEEATVTLELMRSRVRMKLERLGRISSDLDATSARCRRALEGFRTTIDPQPHPCEEGEPAEALESSEPAP